MDHGEGLRTERIERTLDAQLAVVVGCEVTHGGELDIHQNWER
jgi:hypothetical protein